jgi:hypothetical protein
VKRADVDAFYSPYDFEGGNTLDGKRYTELPVPRIPDEEHVLPEGQGAAVEVLGQVRRTTGRKGCLAGQVVGQ